MRLQGLVALLAFTAVGVTAQNNSSTAAAPASSSSSASRSSASSAAPSSSPAASASSNFTLPGGAATASWPSGLVLQSSVPYAFPPTLDVSSLGEATINYRLTNMSQSERQSICDRQTKWCATAGCEEAGAKINQNFCNVETLATRCTCTRGSAALSQYQWPVQMADCQNRASACTQSCWNPAETSIQDRQACLKTCSQTLRDSCSTPGQVAANYAVSKEGQKPNYDIVQGGSASGAMGLVAGKGVTAAVAIMAAVVLVVA